MATTTIGNPYVHLMIDDLWYSQYELDAEVQKALMFSAEEEMKEDKIRLDALKKALKEKLLDELSCMPNLNKLTEDDINKIVDAVFAKYGLDGGSNSLNLEGAIPSKPNNDFDDKKVI